jgi:hypothetical protein
MSRRSAVDQTAREARMAAIRACRSCDPCGWQLGPDRTPIDPAIRCTHDRPPLAPASVWDITEPIHEPDLFFEPIHPHDPEE